MTRPGGDLLDVGHDDAGRRSSDASSQGTLTRGYHPVMGKLETLSGPAGVHLTFGYDGHLLTDVTWSGAVPGSPRSCRIAPRTLIRLPSMCHLTASASEEAPLHAQGAAIAPHPGTLNVHPSAWRLTRVPHTCTLRAWPLTTPPGTSRIVP